MITCLPKIILTGGENSKVIIYLYKGSNVEKYVKKQGLNLRGACPRDFYDSVNFYFTIVIPDIKVL